jgi:hypothetical protein
MVAVFALVLFVVVKQHHHVKKIQIEALKLNLRTLYQFLFCT